MHACTIPTEWFSRLYGYYPETRITCAMPRAHGLLVNCDVACRAKSNIKIMVLLTSDIILFLNTSLAMREEEPAMLLRPAVHNSYCSGDRLCSDLMGCLIHATFQASR